MKQNHLEKDAVCPILQKIQQTSIYMYIHIVNFTGKTFNRTTTAFNTALRNTEIFLELKREWDLLSDWLAMLCVC